MPQHQFQPCIPTRGTFVPAGPDWLHEIKHDGYRLIVQRDGPRVRLFTRRGFDWSDRFPLISEAARRLRPQSFVIDGEEGWSNDLSADVAQEVRRRCDLQLREVPASIQEFVLRHEGSVRVR